MVICAIIDCSKRSGRDTDSRFFTLPTVITKQCEKTLKLSTARRALWLSRIHRADLENKSSLKYIRVCNLHFITGKPSLLFDDSNPDWAPTLNLGHDKLRLSADPSSRYQRLNDRKQLSNVAVNPAEQSEVSTNIDEDLASIQIVEDLLSPHQRSIECQTCPEYVSASCQTDLTGEYLKKFEDEYYSVRTELTELKNRFLNEADLEQSALVENDEKVRFYTGLPTYSVLLLVYNLLVNHVGEETHRNKLSKFKEFFMVLMRLRLNLQMTDLAYRFKVDQSTVSRIFSKWINVMYVRLGSFIHWPERHVLYTSMPASFKRAFGDNVAVIIDCFEVFIDKPTSLLPRAITWSQYKHHNTAKFLIGITPQGTISFISDAWGGRVSDKYLTEQSGILDKLLPGDIVMADRGFDIADTLGFFCAKLLIPAFTRGKSQLSMMDVESTRRIANLRIHVERVIGLVRMKYSILNGILPIETLTSKPGQQPQIDKIAVTCCALTNLCPAVVPLN